MPKTPPAKKPGSARKRAGYEWVFVLLLAVIGFGTLPQTIGQFIDQRTRIADLEQQIGESQERTAELQKEEGRWGDPAFIRSQARGRLLLVNPGDTSYRVLDTPAASVVRAPVEVSQEQHPTVSNSEELFLSSLIISSRVGQSAQVPEPAPTPTERH